MQPEPMTRAELRAGASLSAIFGLRMLGLFFVLPVFAVHAPQYAGGDDVLLVGIALGTYGLTQSILQIPFGMASDRWGRKPVLYAGLLIFAAGSFLAASATDIWTAIAGRSLQGAGAISSVVVALAADLSSEAHRTKVMAMIGSMVGASFALSLVAAPLLYRAIGMGGLFMIIGGLSLAAIWVVAVLVPDVKEDAVAPQPLPGLAGLAEAFGPELLRLNFGILALHMVQMAMFVVVPPLLVESGLALADHWMLYLPVVLASFAVMLPPLLYADRRHQTKPVLIGSVALLLAVLTGLALLGHSVPAMAALLFAFFVAFNVLEAILPSLVSRIAPARARGTAIGVYNTAQTLGLFFGGLGGGWIASRHGAGAVFGACAALTALWLAASAGMRAPARPVNPQQG
jgi:MFS family permease